jgi:N-acetylmuramoyl-L-alanine amidase
MRQANDLTRDTDLKKRLLRAAVADNLRSEDERRRRRLRPPVPARRKPIVRLALLLLLATGLALAQFKAPAVEPLQGAPLGETQNAALAAIGKHPEAAPGPIFAAPKLLDTHVLPLAIRRIVLDAGHGGDDHGTKAGAKTGNRLIEKDVALDIAQRLRQRLESSNFEVLMTRTEDEAISLKERVDFANRSSADIFISIHLNWIETRSVRGIETYFLGSTEDPALNELARRENQASGYTLADMRHLLEGIYADVRQEGSRQLAASVQRALHRSLRKVNPAIQNRGTKTAPFVVLVATEMPAILAEVSCLSNEDEARLLRKPKYRDSIAEALFQGIQSYARYVDQTG